MINKLKKYYHEKKFGYLLLYVPQKLYTAINSIKSNRLSDQEFIQKKYQHLLGTKCNLDNPKTFTEKIQWLKLHDRRDIYTQCADKYAVREYIKKKIGPQYLIPLLFVTDNPKEINKKTIPNIPCIIKTTHDSGGTFLIKNKQNINIPRLQRELKKRLSKNFYSLNREWEYKNIEPKIIIEQLLKDDSRNDQLNDYKIYCFNGKPKFIQTIFDRGMETKEDWYDTDWNPINISYFSPNRKNIEKPKLLTELLTIAKTLAQEFPYVRVDLYISNNQIYFGELTFRPYGGFMRFQPESFDVKLGQYLDLSQVNP